MTTEPKYGEWMPIESAPMDGTPIAVTGFNYGDASRGRHYAIADYELGEFIERGETVADDAKLHYLTHWTPLPPPPESAK